MVHRSCLLLIAFVSCLAYGEPMRLPFEGRWFVYQGGDTPNVNHHMAVRAQWFGIDFVKVGGPGLRALSAPDPKRPEDFYGWNERVVAPAAGTVVVVDDGFADNPIGVRDERHPAGNHVVIRTAAGEFVFLAHLRRETIEVAEGAAVVAGQYIGRVGNSGNSDFPHLHLHVQDSMTAAATGQNPIFSDMHVELTGKAFANVTWPLIRGLFVEAR